MKAMPVQKKLNPEKKYTTMVVEVQNIVQRIAKLGCK